jgi:excisionase family DNA binding protein
MKKLLTTKEVAEYLNVNVETIRVYVRKGLLKSIKLGGKYIRIRPEELEMFVKEYEQKSS